MSDEGKTKTTIVICVSVNRDEKEESLRAVIEDHLREKGFETGMDEGELYRAFAEETRRKRQVAFEEIAKEQYRRELLEIAESDESLEYPDPDWWAREELYSRISVHDLFIDGGWEFSDGDYDLASDALRSEYDTYYEEFKQRCKEPK